MPIKVFISWSGQLSHRVACAFREWLPSVIQSIQPYVSSEDIDKGTRWSTDIAKELEESSYGIICVTEDNLNAPWVSFEAGALSKIIDKSNVTPFLYNIKRSEVQGPLLQFQSAIYEREEVFKLLKSINKRIDEANQITDEQLQKAFGVWWPQLDQALRDIPDAKLAPEKTVTAADTSEILEEILELSRRQQRILNDPESLMPPAYIEHVLGRSPQQRLFDDREDPDIHDKVIHLEHLLREKCAENADDVDFSIALKLVSDIHDYFHSRGRSMRRRRGTHLKVDEEKDSE